MSIEIREAQSADIPSILELIEELEELQEPWRVFPSRPHVLGEIAARCAAAIGDSDELLLVALVGGVVVGTSYAHLEVPSAVSDEPAVELSGVIVRRPSGARDRAAIGRPGRAVRERPGSAPHHGQGLCTERGRTEAVGAIGLRTEDAPDDGSA